LTLGHTGITHNTDVDVTAKVDAFAGDLVHTTEEHQENPPLHLVVSCARVGQRGHNSKRR
jgi:hypothetical protein